MRAPELQNWEAVKLEYDNGASHARHSDNLRRQDMAFVTAAQVAIFTIIAARVMQMTFVDYVLSFQAFIVLGLGLNTELRLSAYTESYMKRLRQIEGEYNLLLYSQGDKDVEKLKLISNSKVFPLYYLVLMAAWIVVWIWNI